MRSLLFSIVLRQLSLTAIFAWAMLPTLAQAQGNDVGLRIANAVINFYGQTPAQSYSYTIKGTLNTAGLEPVSFKTRDIRITIGQQTQVIPGAQFKASGTTQHYSNAEGLVQIAKIDLKSGRFELVGRNVNFDRMVNLVTVEIFWGDAGRCANATLREVNSRHWIGNSASVLSSCAAGCGNGFLQASIEGLEACDDANASNTDGCLNTCSVASCGDGFVQAGVEACDDANAANTDGCLNTCSVASCGDGFVQAGVEECDDANTSNTDGCLNTCYTSNSIAIDAPKNISLIEGNTKNTSYTVSLRTTAQQTVVQTQEIIPQDGGLTFANDAPAAWQSDADIDWVVNGTISGNAVGTYTIKTTALIQGTDISAVAETTVEVESSDPIAQVFVGPPAADPDGIPVNAPTSVDFSVQVNSGTTSGVPDSVTLQAVDEQGALLANLGVLTDDGQNGDLIGDDSIYGGFVVIPSSPEGKLFFSAVAWFGAQSVVSELGSLTVTPFPMTLAPSDPATLIESDDPDQRIFSDQIIVAFEDGTPSSVIAATVATVGGAIIGSIPSLNIFQVGFVSPKTLSELKSLVSAYATQPNVEFAELAAETTTSAVYPNDPSKGSQKNMQVSRVDEVWLLNAGGGTVAIVDTGVDYSHADLDVVKGKDFVSGDDDPMDENGHGTHVSGIAAARINNGQSVAGVVNSKILAVRGIGGSSADLARAIEWAAGKATVVNISGGTHSSKATFEKVTKSLGAKVIVSTAGNDGQNKERYPCANTNVFCVGNSTDADDRAPSSNYGSWVDIAAPGKLVLSTKLGGGTETKSGTSMAAPLVAGAARLIWNANPGWTASKVKQRLLDTAVKAPGLAGKQIGDRIDVFEAFFNGDFEIGTEEWSFVGTCETKASLGPIKPTKGKAMLFCSTGPAGDQVAATLTKTVNFQADSDFTIKFDYNFVSEEYPEYVGSIYDDRLTIKLVAPDGTETILAQESINASSFSPVSGIDFPSGDDTVGQTSWKPVSKKIPVTEGSGSYKLVIEDNGDDIYDTAVLLDNIRLK